MTAKILCLYWSRNEPLSHTHGGDSELRHFFFLFAWPLWNSTLTWPWSWSLRQKSLLGHKLWAAATPRPVKTHMYNLPLYPKPRVCLSVLCAFSFPRENTLYREEGREREGAITVPRRPYGDCVRLTCAGPETPNLPGKDSSGSGGEGGRGRGTRACLPASLLSAFPQLSDPNDIGCRVEKKQV